MSIPPLPFVSFGEEIGKEEAIKYMVLIHQGSAPTPREPEAWASLSQDEQSAVYAAYKWINETLGVTAGLELASPETATPCGCRTAGR